MKRFLEIGGVVAGVVLIAFGVAAVVLGFNGKSTIGNELKQQQIVGTPDMNPTDIAASVAAAKLTNVGPGKAIPLPTCNVADQPINNGDRARCFAEYMKIHALESTGGYVYSQMGIYTAAPDTPKSELMPGGGTSNSMYAATDATTGAPIQNATRNVWVTETALTGALNSSYMADQMANFGIVVGIALLLSGIGFTILALGGALENDFWFFKRPAVSKAATPVSA